MGSIAIAGGGGARTVQTGATNYFVSTTGSDSNNGLTSGTAWATLQHADNVIAINTDLAGFDANISVAAGTYVGVENLTGYFSSIGNPTSISAVIRYTGDQVTPSNVKITATAFRQIGFGQFAPNRGACEVSLKGFDFMQAVDTAIWYDNFYVGTAAQGSVIVSNCQFDAAGQVVPLMAGNISTSGNITVNGAAAGWSGSICTAFMSDGNESATNAVMFHQANTTILGNPNINNLVDQVLVSECLMSGGGAFTGAYTGNPFRTFAHSLFHASGLDWNSASFGTPTGKPDIELGGIFIKTSNQGLEATGGQVLGTLTNYSQPVTGFTLTLGQYDDIVIIDPAGTLATGTIVMASPVVDAQVVSIRSSQIVTTLTISPGAGQSVVGAPTTIGVGGVLNAYFNLANNTWYF